ncbi:sensor domain-containing diguanylate cyclase [Neptunomonas sp.]|uniref:sensor domain-containing diguanylate cyclase n=1 Tax=Neptunomonas sp. TaxID=1971898 RepID=UPI0025FF7AC0|nr:sensor domain-containing diguanylate cyclase [Neptunomonas sp.]
MEVKKNLWFQFVIFLLSGLLIVGLVVASILFIESKGELKELKMEEARLTNLFEQSIEHEFFMVTTDLKLLASHHNLSTYLAHPTEPDRQALITEFLALSQHKRKYDQVRLLNNDGNEVIRINFNDGLPESVPQNQLQSKADRYYFQDSIKLAKGQIFFSPFDLNVEQGKIEQPIKPIIRIAVPLFDSNGDKKGILILNYLGQHLFNHIKSVVDVLDSRATVMLINMQGYFLKGRHSDEEWGFMYKDEQRSFASKFPQAWKNIKPIKGDMFENHKGLFTFTTVYPLRDHMVSSSGSVEPFGTSSSQIDPGNYSWKLVVYVPSNILTQNTLRLLNTMNPILLAIVFLVFVVAFFIAQARVRHELDDESIERMAHFDELTGLPNRTLLYGRLDQLIQQEEPSTSSFALLFIDLDGFKDVNDKYGHNTGDQVLKETAVRIQLNIRKIDTAARIGGDEFLVVLTGVSSPRDAASVAKKIIDSFNVPFQISEVCKPIVGASIGISVYPSDGKDADMLIKQADVAMYRAKNAGKNGFSCYSDSLPEAETTTTE